MQKYVAFARNVRRSTKYPRYESYRNIYETKETLLRRDRLQKSTPLHKSPRSNNFFLSFNFVRFVSCACPSKNKFKPYRPLESKRSVNNFSFFSSDNPATCRDDETQLPKTNPRLPGTRQTSFHGTRFEVTRKKRGMFTRFARRRCSLLGMYEAPRVAGRFSFDDLICRGSYYPRKTRLNNVRVDDALLLEYDV